MPPWIGDPEQTTIVSAPLALLNLLHLPLSENGKRRAAARAEVLGHGPAAAGPRLFDMISRDQADAPPRNVLLFSGHMIDAPGRKDTRFPAGKEFVAADAIARLLDTSDIDASPSDLAICGGACGGDLLFAEACLARGTTLELYIPFDEPTFLANSVDFADSEWRARFYAVKSKATLHVMPDELGVLLAGENAYERNNLWMLDSAGRFGAEKIIFICLWNGKGGDGPGGARHLMEEIWHKSKRIHWLNTTALWT